MGNVPARTKSIETYGLLSNSSEFAVILRHKYPRIHTNYVLTKDATESTYKNYSFYLSVLRHKPIVKRLHPG